ncbi:hypothetical protein BH09ACT8_BH09ACT8_30200 [soil metagenome]
MRTMLMQPTAAALCAVCLAAPLALPDGGTLASAPGHDLALSAAAVNLVAATSSALPANPTLLEVLGLPIQTVNNIFAEGTTGAQALPAGIPLTSAQYVSVYEALNAYIKVGSTIAVQLVNGQFESIAPSFQTNLAAAMTALQGLPPSIAASLQYNLGVISAFIASFGVSAPNTTTDAAATADAKTVAVSAATSSVLPTNPTLLEVLGLPIQTVNNIFAEGTTGAQALPAGFPLTSAQYVSVYEALNAYIKVGSTIAAQLVNGQFESIPTSFQTNLAAANTALMGLAPSVAASLQYNLGVIQNFFAGPNVSATADKTLAVSATPTALPANPTLLEVLGLQIQTLNNIYAAGTTGAQALPTGFPLTAAQYVSVFNVLNAYIKIGSTVAAQLVNGQFESIAASFQTNLTAADTALQGFAPSVAASLQYDFDVIQNFFATPSAAVASDAAASDTKTLAVSAATPTVLPANPTLLDVLGLQIQTANNIFAAGTTGAQALPAGFPLTAAQYVSVFNAANAYIKVGSTVAVQLVNGQFEQIAPSFQANLAAANTTLQGLAPSIGASLQYDAAVVGNFLAGGAPTTAEAAAAKADAPALASAATADTAEKATDTADSVTALPKATPKVAPKKTAPAGGFLKQLQSAVDNEVGGGKVKVDPAKSEAAPKPVKHADATKASDPAKSDSAKSAAGNSAGGDASAK